MRPTLRLALLACLPASGAWAQATPAAPATAPTAATTTQPPADVSPSLLDSLKLPDLRKLNLPLPRSVQAANALLGLATQRLALVVGTGNVGPQIQLPSVSRDTQAVAAALRAAGFVVMVREDLNAEDLRAALDEFRGRLQPGGTGFLYFAGLGAQVGGENVVLTRGLQVTGTGPNTRLKGTAVPLQEIVEAVQGTPDSPRYLVVDAAFSHPTLATISSQGLAAQKVPPGVMALFSQSPGVAAEAPEPFPLPLPTPTDPRLTAGSTFGRELVRSLVTPKLNGSDILRVTRGAMLDVTAGKQAPLIVGESASQDEFAEPNLLDTLFPRTPEDLAREGLKQALRAGSNAGDVPVSQVGTSAPPVSTPAPATTAPATPAPASESLASETPANGPTAQRNALDSATRRLADGPSPTSLLTTAAGATAAVGSAAVGAAGTAAVAGTMAATAQAGAMATAMGVATSVASSAAGVLSSVAALVSGGGSSSGGGAAAAVAANEASKLVRPASALGALSQAGGGNSRSQGAAVVANALPAAGSTTSATSATTAGASSGTSTATGAPATAAPAAPTPTAANAAPAVQVAQAAQAAQSAQAVQAAPGGAGPAATAGTDPAAAAAAAANPAAGAQAARNAQALAAQRVPAEAAGAAGTAGNPATATAAAGQDLPVSAINGAVPAAATTAAAPATGGFPEATPRTSVPQSASAEQWPATAQQAPGQPRTAKQQSGGERPAYVPKVNPHGYAEGDTFMYRTMDTWKDQHLGNSVHTVEEVLPNGDLLTDGHQSVLDAQGRFKRLRQLDGTVSQFEPAQELWWSNPARGQRRDILFKETFQRADMSRGQTEWKGSARVGRPTKISTQAGEFEVLPIESSGWYYQQVGRGPLNSGQWSRTVWYSPKLGHPVAIDIEDANALGKLLKRERVELLQVQSAKSLAASAP
jgi:hypothetical protein